MQNFIIDTSVFTLPVKSEDAGIEKNNLCMLRNNIACLRRLQYNNLITVSYMNKIILRLKKNNYLISKSDINYRIKELLNKNPEFKSEIGMDSVIFENWDETLFNVITPKADESGVIRKGKIGIFNNIPDRYGDPPDSYANMTNFPEAKAKKVYPKLSYDFFKTFKKYCGYIADLNYKYHSFNNNYFVLGGDYGKKNNKNLAVTLNENGNFIQSRINVVGIQNTGALCPQELKFKDLITACEEAIKKYSEKLDFGKDINNDNLKKDLLPIAGPPEKVYGYLETLHHICKLTVKEGVSIKKKEELVELLNSYGLLCSPEDEKYGKNKCKHRQFLNKLGEKKYYNIHLKPATYNNNATDEYDLSYTLGGEKGSVRIYLDWDDNEKKFILGWIGRHPPFCKDCVNTTCQGY